MAVRSSIFNRESLAVLSIVQGLLSMKCFTLLEHGMSNQDPIGLKAYSDLIKANEFSNIHPFRDQYVTVNEVNVQADKLHNFDKKNPSSVLLNGAYDYSSVMHYSRCAFSKNNLETITVLVRYPIIIKNSLIVIHLNNPSQDSSATIGQRSGMTQLDVNKLMSFYGC